MTPKQKCYRRVLKAAQVICHRFLVRTGSAPLRPQNRNRYQLSIAKWTISGHYQTENLLNLMGHSQLWGRGDPDTSFATLKSVYLIPKYRQTSDTSRNSPQSCLVFHSIFDIFLSIVFIHPIILFYHI